ncbi:MAG: hypothetical protein EOP04_19420 [Proteobacteria bacterium]|nr:MAG: hypothetical protein EOP04_19420 [Pseudomonadota bacterium]
MVSTLITYLDSRQKRLTEGSQPGKGAYLSLLRFSSEALRRLSKSKNLQSCGRVLMFMANVYPLSDKSGIAIC